eukprot:CAMPEP_0114428314 /NCGR_PEP_ID=MMETSP0103-20121206/8855_1 /TAXON_ID=37642 ORGANISM="Paraphysomonas imperforata, Strain PA2" /NCGR_SAMPLE_ID=MMETSP0103 /ASSEMBLY_ACC=CAM_ASM_000201 /LENGTH=70 /DNA_ID=CAMNT_0001597513 /DNA_START=61 /DNA_END=273 /DNA_ORIENTATION=+
MTRGNQREIDRARAAARKGSQGTKQAGNPQQRNEENAKRLAEKIAKKQEMAASGAVPEKKKGHGGGAKKK